MWKEWIHPVVGAAAILAAVIGFVAAVGASYSPVPPAALPLPRDLSAGRSGPPARGAVPSPPAAPPRGVSTTAGPAARTVFRCLKDGVPAYSAVPCGPGAQPMVLDPASLNTYHAPPVQRRAVETPADGQPVTTDIEPGPANASQCRWVDAAQREVEERMRHAYVEPEGNRLRAELHRLNGLSSELNCGR